MKNLKINEKKMNEILKKGIALISVPIVLTTVSGCSQSVPEDWPSEFSYVSQENNNFEDLSKIVIQNGEAVSVYPGENIAVAVNNDTYDVKEYLFYNGFLSGTAYDMETGYLISDLFVTDTTSSADYKNVKSIYDNNSVIEFSELGDYVEGEETKEYYTLEEIRALEPIIVESVKKINNYNKKLVK